LEAKIKDLDGNTDAPVLKIKSSDGMDDHDKQIKFSGIRMPNLEEFYSKNVYLTKWNLRQKQLARSKPFRFKICQMKRIAKLNAPN
jgi:hypothetical protein